MYAELDNKSWPLAERLRAHLFFNLGETYDNKLSRRKDILFCCRHRTLIILLLNLLKMILPPDQK
jgi:hypothetical protein